jgi:hypothetical protein
MPLLRLSWYVKGAWLPQTNVSVSSMSHLNEGGPVTLLARRPIHTRRPRRLPSQRTRLHTHGVLTTAEEVSAKRYEFKAEISDARADGWR